MTDLTAAHANLETTLEHLQAARRAVLQAEGQLTGGHAMLAAQSSPTSSATLSRSAGVRLSLSKGTCAQVITWGPSLLGCAPALAHETGSVEPMSTPKHPDVPTPADVANVGDWQPMPARSGWFRWPSRRLVRAAGKRLCVDAGPHDFRAARRGHSG
jgi:hypothetical protein